MSQQPDQPRQAPQASPSSAAPSGPVSPTLISYEEAGIPKDNPLLVWISANLKSLILATAGVLLLAALWSGVSYWRESQRREAAQALGEMLLAKQGAELAAGLEAFIADAPSPVRTAAMLELVKATAGLGDANKTAAQWARLAATAEEPLKLVALMGQAQSLAQGGAPRDALVMLKPLAAAAPEAMLVPLTRLKALVAEQAGDLAEASAAYGVLLEKSPEQNRAFYAQKLADLERRKAGQGAS